MSHEAKHTAHEEWYQKFATISTSLVQISAQFRKTDCFFMFEGTGKRSVSVWQRTRKFHGRMRLDRIRNNMSKKECGLQRAQPCHNWVLKLAIGTIWHQLTKFV
jgi:hypothetical protein